MTDRKLFERDVLVAQELEQWAAAVDDNDRVVRGPCEALDEKGRRLMRSADGVPYEGEANLGQLVLAQ